MSENGNGDQLGQEIRRAISHVSTLPSTLWVVYEEQERQALADAGLDVVVISAMDAQDRDIVLLYGNMNSYAVGRVPDDISVAYKFGAASVRAVIVPVPRGSNIAKAITRQRLSIEEIEIAAASCKISPNTGARPAPAYDEKGRINWDRLSNDQLGMRLVSSIKARRIDWLMRDRIPAGAYTLIAGEGKQGKSQLTMAIASLLSTGGEWWDGSGPAPCGHVLLLSAEDDAQRAIRPRLEALGADLDRITVLEARYKIPDRDDREPLVHFAELSDLAYWREVFRRVADPVAIVIDPIPSYIGASVNDRKNSEVRAVLGPFIDLATSFGMTVIGITHLGKTVDPGRSITSRVLDSIAYTNLARAIHFVARDPEDHDRKFFMPGPCNYAPGDLEAMAFRLVEKQVTTDDGEVITVAVADFEPGTVDVNPQDVVSAVGRKKPGPAASKVRRELAEWLFERLKGQQPVAAGLLYNEAAEAFADRKPNPLGVKGPDGYWTMGRNLVRAADIDVPELPYPQNGRIVDRFRDPTNNNRWYWRLVDKAQSTQASEAATDAAF